MKITHSLEDVTQWFFETLVSLQNSQGVVTVGLGGGSSFDAWYSELLISSEWEKIDLTRVRFCVTDERVNCDIAERNDAHIWSTFFLPFIEKGFGLPNFIRPIMGDNGSAYGEIVGDVDIAFFGMGPDGHTASLFPHHPALSSEEIGFIKIDNAPKFPPERISLSPKSIQALKHVCLFVVGAQKKEALANFLDNSVSVDDCPAKLLQPEILFDLTD